MGLPDVDQNAEGTLAQIDDLWAFQFVEETSRRLASRLSNGPCQLLANAVFELSASLQLLDEKPALAKEGLGALEEELRVGLRALQQLVFELNPPLLREFGLPGTIRNYMTRFEKESGLNIHLDIDYPKERLPMTFEIMVFRVLQEALHNVQQHAKATDVWVRLHPTGDTLELTVEDNGVGLDFDQVVSGQQLHLGLVSMHDRARVLGGTLIVGNRVDGGTQVQFVAPWTASQ